MEVLTAQELEHLAEVREVTTCANSAGWIRILQQMEKFVAEAHEDMFGAVYASDAIKANLQNRWQQREAMLRGVKQYVGDCEEQKKLLIESVTPRSVPVEEYAEQDREEGRWEFAR
jgi:hypothetical protein